MEQSGWLALLADLTMAFRGALCIVEDDMAKWMMEKMFGGWRRMIYAEDLG